MNKSAGLTDQEHFRALCLFSLALLAITAFTTAVWMVLSVTLFIPTSAEVATKLGIINGVSGMFTKPEPVENYTFFLSTGAGVLLFGLAGYISVSRFANVHAKLCAT